MIVCAACLPVVLRTPSIFSAHTQVVQTVVFLLLVLTYSTIVDIPWSVYSTFVLEEKHGFNKQVPICLMGGGDHSLTPPPPHSSFPSPPSPPSLSPSHSYHTQTMGFFIKDKVKMFLLLCLLVPPIGAGLVAVIHWGGDHFYIYAWSFVFIISLVHTHTHTYTATMGFVFIISLVHTHTHTLPL